MSDSPRPLRRRVAIWSLVVTLLFTLYLLSAGPWSYAHRRGNLPYYVNEAILLFYLPLRIVHDHTRFFQDCPIGQSYKAYVEWWEDL